MKNFELDAQNAELDAQIVRLDRRHPFILFREFSATSRKQWLVRDLLGDGEASAVYGKPGDGKSVLVEDMALHIAAGRQWHGREVKHGAVLYVALERKALVERRAIAFRNRHGLTDLPFAIMGGVLDLRDPKNARILANVVREVEAVTGQEVVLIVIDTLSRALSGGDENSPKDMGAIVNATSILQHETNAHVLWIHHTPIDGADRMRGHGALLGAMDTTINVAKAGAIRTATVMKANDSEEGAQVAFTLESEAIGTDDAGNETTAPVAVPAETSSAPRRHSKWPRGLRLLHDVLTAMALDHGIDHRVGQDGPLVKAVPIHLVREEHNRRYVSTGEGDRDNAERQAWRRNFQLARNQRLIGGELTATGEFIWLAVA